MQVHCDDVITACGLQHVGNQLCGDGSSRFILLVLSCVGEVGDHSCDAASRGGLACVDHDEEFHETVVDIAGGSGLKDEY